MYERETMTREESIKELRDMKTDPWTDNRQMEAIDIAINTIKAGEIVSLKIAQEIAFWNELKELMKGGKE